MLKKKLIILFLIGNIVTGVTTSSTIISLATPVEKSSNILHSKVIESYVLFYNLYKDTSSHNFEFAEIDAIRYKVRSQLLALKKSGNIQEFKSKFHKISNELDSLRNKEHTLFIPFTNDMHQLYYMADYTDNCLNKCKSMETWINNVGYQLPKLLESGKDTSVLKTKFYDLSKELEFLIANTSTSKIASNAIKSLIKFKTKSSIFLDFYCNTIDTPLKLKEDEKKCKSKVDNLLNEIEIILYSLNINRSNDLKLQLEAPNNKSHEIKKDMLKNPISQVNLMNSENSKASVYPLIQPVSSNKPYKLLNKMKTLFDRLHKMIPKNSISQVNLIEPENPVSSVAPLENIKKSKVNEIDGVIKVHNSNQDSKCVNVESSNSPIETKVPNKVTLFYPVVPKVSSNKSNKHLYDLKILFNTFHKTKKIIPKTSISKIVLDELYKDTCYQYVQLIKTTAMSYKVNSQLVALKKSGNIREFKSKFHKISSELDSLQCKNTTLIKPFIDDMHRLSYLTDYKGSYLNKLKSMETWIDNVGYQLPVFLEGGKEISVLKNKFYDLSKELECLIANTSTSKINNDTINSLMKVKTKSSTLLDMYSNIIDNSLKLKEDEKKCKSKINNLLDEIDIVLYSLNINLSNDLRLRLEVPDNKSHEIKKDMPKNSISQVNPIESENPETSVYPAIQQVSSSKSNKPLNKIITLFDRLHKMKKITPKNSISQVNLMEQENPVSSISPLEKQVINPIKPYIDCPKIKSISKIENVNLGLEENIKKLESNKEDNVPNKVTSVYPVIQQVSSSKSNKPLNKIKTLFDTFHKMKKITPKNSISQVNLMEQENPVPSISPLEKQGLNPIKPYIDCPKIKSISKIENVNLGSEENIKKLESNKENNVIEVNSNQDSNSINIESSNTFVENKISNEVSSNVIILKKSIEKQILLPETESYIMKDQYCDNKEKIDEAENMIIIN